MIVAGHAWGKLLMRIPFQPSLSIYKLRKQWFESSAGEHAGQQILTHTSILVQEGLDIQEVPLIVRKINDVEAICSSKDKRGVAFVEARCKFSNGSKKNDQLTIDRKNNLKSTDNTRLKGTAINRRIDVETDEGTAILFCSDLEYLKESDIEEVLEGLNTCNTKKGIYTLMESKITQEINCRVALEGIRKIIELESSWNRHKPSKVWGNERSEVDAINRDIMLKQLVKLITKSQDSEMILQGLVALKRDRCSPIRNVYRDWMCDEALSRATDGEFTLLQLMNVVKIFSSYKDPRYRKSVDMLWVGIASREQDIDADTLVPLFKLLKYFDQSKIMVQIILEKKFSDHWLNLTGSQIAEILDSFHDEISAMKCLKCTSKWTSVSMSTSEEKDIINLIHSLDAKDYIDEKIEEALKEYMKTKSSEIKDPVLIAAVMNYCRNLQIRNPCILSECGKYFIKHGMNIPASLLSSILIPFGLLYVQPPNTEKFWETFDEVLSARFHNLKLIDTVDILLCCTYLEKYPTKFFNKIFLSHFLNRIHLKKNSAFFNRIKSKLKFFDVAMSLECKDYPGPYFSFERTEKSLFLDTRIRRMVNNIYQPLARLVGGEQKLTKNIVLSRLPLINFYVLDILIHPFLVSTPVFHLNPQQKRNINTAVLIHLPEYYCRNTHHLVGPQVMRKRHIRKLGFRVMTLDYMMLEQLLNQPDKLWSYLSQSLESAEDAL